MPFRSKISRVACAASVVLGLAISSNGADPVADKYEPAAARVAVGMGSAQNVLDSLEYMVVKLANKKKSWDDNIFPNLDIFLIGVSNEDPIRFDLVFDPVHGYQTQAMVPTANLKDFRENNLDPIGIVTTQDKSDKNLYKVTGGVYEGWMRYLPKPAPYSVFFAQKEGIPANMPHPESIHKEFAEQGLLGFLSMENQAAGKENRVASFKAFRVTSDEKFKKLSTETRDQFEFRKALRDETMAILEQWLVEIQKVSLTAKVDQAKGSFPVALDLAALPDTALTRDIKTATQIPSLFAAVDAPKNNIFTVRVNIPKNAERLAGMRKVYELGRPVVKERIDNNTKANAGEKVALNEIASTLLDVLTENLDTQKNVNGMIDVWPANGKHTILMAVAATGEEKFNEMISKISSAREGWTVAMNADKVGDTAIHRVTFGKNPPKSFIDFYGPSNEAWLGVNSKSVWLSGGEDSLAALKAALAKVDADKSPAADGVLVVAEMNARPVIQNIDAIQNDPELEILKQINPRGRRQERLKEGKAEEEKKADEQKPGQRAAGNLANFIWIPSAVAALEGQQDRMALSLKIDDKGHVVGTSDAQVGILKALGAVIAKFSDENLK
ncbi:hypothetical protein SH661x_000731 [Planctomicrobium sp. SH661]|uniref:hypothetical protein n=1 Tax=Planctomicrobium sp. SH661 TaxID=3448124 RepID=UPI003F5C5D15